MEIIPVSKAYFYQFWVSDTCHSILSDTNLLIYLKSRMHTSKYSFFEIKNLRNSKLTASAKFSVSKIRPGQVDSQFIITAHMFLNASAWNFIIGISNQNTLIEQSFCFNRAISCNMKDNLPPAWLFEISLIINCESTWPGLTRYKVLLCKGDFSFWRRHFRQHVQDIRQSLLKQYSHTKQYNRTVWYLVKYIFK